MNRILIVEDEKMIRKGIVTMVKRLNIPIEEVLEARNGQEALEILKATKIDILLTDIRMPKMDGITLVNHLGELADRPKVIVISGYEDFNYAVQLLRGGVKDYLLKPIEREKLGEVLNKIHREIREDREQEDTSNRIIHQQLKYLLINEQLEDSEIGIIEKNFKKSLPNEQYVICCLNKGWEVNKKEEDIFYLSDIGQVSVMLMAADRLEKCLQTNLKGSSVGISKIHQDIREIRLAYLEATMARKEAFVKCVPFCYYREQDVAYETIPEDFAEQFVQLFGTAKMEDALKKFVNIRFKAEVNKVAGERLLEITSQIVEKLVRDYGRVIEFDMEEVEALKNPLDYIQAETYYSLLDAWLLKMHNVIMQEFDDYKNKEKINMAIQYIKENYKSDLNMAVVSNYISMNYSLFSLNFKRYTGMKFVDYLKKIRMDEAKYLLEETEQKVIDISKKVGYENEKHFMKTFKNMYGVSPSEYRKKFYGKKMI